MHKPLAGGFEQNAVAAAGFFPEASMTAYPEIWLAAQGMLAAQGEHAARECEAVIESRRKQGDQAGVEKWTQVLTSIRQLQEFD
jgi:hypothetical protein